MPAVLKQYPPVARQLSLSGLMPLKAKVQPPLSWADTVLEKLRELLHREGTQPIKLQADINTNDSCVLYCTLEDGKVCRFVWVGDIILHNR